MGNEEAVLSAVLHQGQQIGEMKGTLEQHINNQDLVNAQLAKLLADQDARISVAQTTAEKAHGKINKLVNKAVWTGTGFLGALALLGVSISSKIKLLLDHLSRLP